MGQIFLPSSESCDNSFIICGHLRHKICHLKNFPLKGLEQLLNLRTVPLCSAYACLILWQATSKCYRFFNAKRQHTTIQRHIKERFLRAVRLQHVYRIQVNALFWSFSGEIFFSSGKFCVADVADVANVASFFIRAACLPLFLR